MLVDFLLQPDFCAIFWRTRNTDRKITEGVRCSDEVHGIETRRRFPSPYHGTDHNLSAMMRRIIHAWFARFVEAQPFFLIATASAYGHCEASSAGTNMTIQALRAQRFG